MVWENFNDTIDQLDLIDIYRTFHPKTMNFNFFSSAHGTSSRIDHILGHKSSLGKFKKTEFFPSIFSDHHAARLDRRKTIKNSNIRKLNNTLLNNQQITEEIEKEIKICIEMNENGNNNAKPVGHCKSSAKEKVHSNTGIPQETRKKSNK